MSVADIHRCLVDMLDEPYLGGGIQHVADCFRNYIRHEDSDFTTLVDYADKLGNGAVFKRLGFLAEREGVNHLVESCTAYLTSGNAKLDSSVACPRLITRWRLLVPHSWARR